MEKLKTRIHFKSGRTLDLTSHDYYAGQFKEWCMRNFITANGMLFDKVQMGEVFVVTGQIEYVEEVK